MDFLKAEIARKRKQVEESKVLAEGGQKKYFRRGDLSAKMTEDYLVKHGLKAAAGADSGATGTSSKATPVGSAVTSAEEADELVRIKAAGKEKKVELRAEEVPVLPRVEVVRRLRERQEPILLFGESEDEACQRLRQLEFEEPEKVEGIRNDFKDAMAKVDEVYLQDILKSQGTDEEDKRSKYDVQLYDCEHSYDDLQDMVNDTNKGDASLDLKLIAEFIKLMLRFWGEELNAREEDLKMSVRGKIEAGTYAQTRTYVKPLLRMIRKQTVTDDIRDSLLKMVKYALQRDYILCNEAYMEMAIGNAPWPIGVTNAGIHARPARENIFSKHVAHVLNDETQRKYIQGLKRLLTKSQQYYPTDPSRSIDYVRKEDNSTSSSSAREEKTQREISFVSPGAEEKKEEGDT